MMMFQPWTESVLEICFSQCKKLDMMQRNLESLIDIPVLTQGEFNLETRHAEPELCFPRARSRHPRLCLLDSGHTRVLLSSNVQPTGAPAYDVSIDFAIGKGNAEHCCSEV